MRLNWLVLSIGWMLTLSTVCFSQQPRSESPARLVEWYRWKCELRDALAPIRQPKYSLQFLQTDGVEPRKPFDFVRLPERIVLVLGGLQSNSDAATEFTRKLHAHVESNAKCGYAIFDYPNDGPIAESGSVLREYLRNLGTAAPATRVSIVAHSMGSIVARYAIETPDGVESVAPTVDRLIMICPPNHGSALAQYGDALELTELMDQFQKKGFGVEPLLEVLVHDGMGEACEDLLPNSPLLQNLNARPRRRGVRYSLAIGTGGPITPSHQMLTTLLWDGLRKELQVSSPEDAWLLSRCEELLTCDELMRGKGDGAVSCRSALLPGVHEKATFGIHHVQWLDQGNAEVDRMLQWIARRAYTLPKD